MSRKLDIFVSYAHVDNQPFSGQEDGWITHFVNNLRTEVSRRMGRMENYSLWMDFRLKGSDEITPEIEKQLENVHTLVVLLSRGWLASRWCQRELTIFSRNMKHPDGRIFVIELENIAEDEKPIILHDLKNYPFWEKDKHDEVQQLGYPVPRASDDEYVKRLVSLSHHLAKAIQAKQSNIFVQTTPKATIYVAPVNDSLYRQRESLISGLNQYQIAVLPHNNTFNGDMRKDLAECSHFVQLLDSDSVMGIPQQQYQTAQEADKPILQWRDPKLDFSGDAINPAQKTLLQGKTVIAAALPDFIRMVRDAVLPKPPKPPEEEIPVFNHGKKMIYVHAGQEDYERARDVAHTLKNKGYGIAWSRYQGEPERIRKSIERGFQYCDILLILQQSVSADVVEEFLVDAQILAKKRDTKPPILICHSQEAEELSFIPSGVLTLECRSNFHEHCLDQFLARVEA